MNKFLVITSDQYQKLIRDEQNLENVLFSHSVDLPEFSGKKVEILPKVPENITDFVTLARISKLEF